jgi:hypothetical protein
MKVPQSLLFVFSLLISFSDAKSSVRRKGRTRGHSKNSLADGPRDLQADLLARKGSDDDPNVGGKGGTPALDPGAPSTAPNEDGGQPDSSGPGSSQNPMTPTSGPTFIPTSPTLPPTTSPPRDQQTQPPQPAPTMAPPTSNPSPQLPDASNPMADPQQANDSPQMDGCAAAAQGIDAVTTKSIRVTYLYEILTHADSLWYNVVDFLDTAIQGFLATSLVTCDGTSTPVGDVRGIAASGLNQVTGDACTGITLYDPALLSCYVMNGTMVVYLSPASTMTEEEIRTQVWDTLRADFNNNKRRRLSSSLLNPGAAIVGLYFLSQEDPTVDPLNRGNVQVSGAQSTKPGLGLGPAVSAGLAGGAIFLLAILGFVYVKQRGAERSKTEHSLWAPSEGDKSSVTMEEDVKSEPRALDSGFDDRSVSPREFPQFLPSTEDVGHEQSWSPNNEWQSYDYSSTSMSSSRLGTGRKKGHASFSENATSSTVAEQWERGATIKTVIDRDDSPVRIYPFAEGDTVDF